MNYLKIVKSICKISVLKVCLIEKNVYYEIFVCIVVISILLYRSGNCLINNYCGLTKVSRLVENGSTEYMFTIIFCVLFIVISIVYFFIIKRRWL